MKCYNGETNTDFRNSEMPEDRSCQICFSITFIDSFLKQVKTFLKLIIIKFFLEVYTYAIKEKEEKDILTAVIS